MTSKTPKVVLITGASSGIGEATAYLFTKNGYSVAIHGATQSKVDKVVENCKKLSAENPDQKHLGICLNLENPTNGAEIVKKTVEFYKKLDILINNAGIYMKTKHDSPDSYDVYKKIQAINTDSTVSASLEAIKHLKETKGNIVIVSSTAALQASNERFGYNMSKAAVSIFGKALAIELAPSGVRVNIVSPGPVRTDIGRSLKQDVPMDPQTLEKVMKNLNLLGRMGESDEIARAIYFVATPGSEYIVGHEFVIDGGNLINRTTP